MENSKAVEIMLSFLEGFLSGELVITEAVIGNLVNANEALKALSVDEKIDLVVSALEGEME